MTATIPLAQPGNERTREYPGYLSVKLDGVPVRVDVTFRDGCIAEHTVRSRQGHAVPSVSGQVAAFLTQLGRARTMSSGGQTQMTFVFEVTHKSLRDFKDVSGVVRRQEPQDDLILNLFDFVHDDAPQAPFTVRRFWVGLLLNRCTAVELCRQRPVLNADDFRRVEAELLHENPGCEGLVYRSASAQWAPGKRLPDYQKILHEPTADLWITGVEEAVDKNGNPKGMAGRLVASYKGTEIGVGPGKLTHAERVALWVQHKDGTFNKRLAQIKYKADASYTALRQATFQHWRDDKSEADA